MKEKNVLIDGSPLFNHKTGIEQYLHHLLEALFLIDTKNNYTVYAFLFFGKKLRLPFNKKFPNVHFRMIRFIPSKLFNFISAIIFRPPVDLLTATRPDVVFFGNFVRSPLLFGAKSITVIYDLSFIKFRQYADVKTADFLIKEVPLSVAKSDLILTISQHAKQEIIEYYHISEDKIKIINPAVDHEVFYAHPTAKVRKVIAKLGIRKPYILYTGTLEPRKNIEGILDAYAKLDKSLQEEYSLVLAGGGGWEDGGIRTKLSELVHLDIITTGYIDDKDLPLLYSGASVFVYPSFYEGFGMPPLEAMACGVPVITSNNSSLPEVLGNAGIQLDAHDSTGLSDAISRVLRSPALRSRLIAAGKIQAKSFSWKNSAQQLKEIIDQ